MGLSHARYPSGQRVAQVPFFGPAALQCVCRRPAWPEIPPQKTWKSRNSRKRELRYKLLPRSEGEYEPVAAAVEASRRKIGRGQATLTLPWTKKRSNPAGCKSMMSICRNRIAPDREAHGTKTVPWLPVLWHTAGSRMRLGWSHLSRPFLNQFQNCRSRSRSSSNAR